jgi:hypothetical protein
VAESPQLRLFFLFGRFFCQLRVRRFCSHIPWSVQFVTGQDAICSLEDVVSSPLYLSSS